MARDISRTEDLDVDLKCMDTHVVNAILTGCRSKSSLIESVSCSSKIIPPELSQDSDFFFKYRLDERTES